MEQISSRAVYANAWLSVREDQIRFPDGTPGSYGVVDKRDCTLVIPRDGDGLWMVEQHRYAVGLRTLEFPQGAWPAGQTGSPAELARTELREETGLSAGRLTHLGRFFTAPGFCTQSCDVYLAEDLAAGPTDREVTEQDMTHRLVPLAQFRDLASRGDITDSATLAAYAMFVLAGHQ